MTTRILFLGLGLGWLLGAGHSGSEPGTPVTVTREVALSPEALGFHHEAGTTRLTLEGGTRGFPPGWPDLPTLPVLVGLPPGTRPTGVRVEVLETRSWPGPYEVSRVPLPDPGAPLEVSPPDGQDRNAPDSRILRLAGGRMRGQSLASAVVAPVTWDPETGRVDLAVRFRVVVVAAEVPPTAGEFRPERESPEGRRSFEHALSRLTGGAGVPGRGATAPLSLPSGPFAPGFRPTADGSPVEMVILTDAAQASEYERLADYKTRTGLSTVVRTVEWVEAEYARGSDRAETIRLFLREAAARWGTAWVLLGGDTGVIPAHHVQSAGYPNDSATTDLYYSDLDGDWNADGDSWVGEGSTFQIPGDGVDLFPDLWVGRLPSNNAAEAALVVDKVLAYLDHPPLGYQRDALIAAEVLFPAEWVPGQNVAVDGATLAESVVDSLPAHFQPVRLYENHTAWPGALPETKDAVLDSLDAGFHLVHMVAHGFINTISVGLQHATLDNADVDGLQNGDELFVLVTMDCTSSAVDFNCIAERFLLNPNGGAVASIGSTEVEFPSSAIVYQNSFYHELFSGSPRIGEALGMCKIPWIVYSQEDNTHRWTQFALILLGDPSMPFWTDVPAPLTVSHAPVFELGGGAFVVSVSRGGQPVAGARVTLTKDGDDYAVAETDGSGTAAVPFVPDTIGEFTVGVTATDGLPYLGTAEVAPSVNAYLFAETQNLTDSGGSAQGNGDGLLDAGETVELRFGIRNTGCTLASGIQAQLGSADSRLTILDGISGYPSLSPGGAAVAGDRMLVRVNRSTPDGTEIPATLTVTGPGGPFVEDVLFRVHAPVVEFRQQVLRDTVGNGDNDGIITGNEDFVIIPVLRNTGRGALRGASVRLRSASSNVVLNDTLTVLGDVAPRALASNPAEGLRLRIKNFSSPPELILAVHDAYGEIAVRRIDVTPPSAVAAPTALGSSSSIGLTWDPVPDQDLWGYEIQKAPTEAGPFQQANEWIVLGGSRYEDGSLPGFTRSAYRVAAVDSSGNRGPWSPPIQATTSLPLHPGWPADMGAPVPAGVNAANLDGSGTLEVLGGGAEIMVFSSDGQDFVDGDQTLATRGPFTNTGRTQFWNTPAAGDLTGDGTLEVAAIGWDDALLHLVDAQAQPVPGWPRTANPLAHATPNPVGSVVLADADGDGDLEVFATTARAVLGWHHDGTEILDGDGNPATDGVIAATGTNFSYGSPSVANIDAEPRREIIAGMRDGKLYVFEHDGTPYPGFPFLAGASITSSPAVGDIDGDGRVEIVFGSADSTVHALRSDLSSASGFPVTTVALGEDWDSSPALGDVTGDGAPDVVIAGSDGLLHVLSGVDGTEPSGYPVDLGLTGPVVSRSSPVLVDLDANGSIDILVGDRAGRLHGYDPAGNPLQGFPIQTGNRIDGAAAVADVDGDGLSEVLVESNDQSLYVWDTPWTYDPGRAPWPMFKANPAHTGSLDDAAFGGHVGLPEDPTPGLGLRAGPNPFRLGATLSYRVPEGSAATPVRLVVYDLAGREVRTLVEATQPAGRYAVAWNGEDAANRRVGAGVYLYRLRVGRQTGSGKLVLLP